LNLSLIMLDVMYDFGAEKPASLIPVILDVAVIFGLIAANYYDGKLYNTSTNQRLSIRGFLVLALVFLVVGLFSAAGNRWEYFKLNKAYEKKEYKTVQGAVENFQAFGPPQAKEQFTVNGVAFELPGSTSSGYGFDEMGKIKESLPVIIYYASMNGKNVILYLDVKYP
jgi:hypothetical protein